MATVSRQSAFWAVVALGLNTFTQDGGKVLGFPAEYSRALRLSPIVCIVDTLGVLFSVAFFSYRTRSFRNGLTLAARYRGLTEDHPAEPKLERTWWFRLSVFTLGALPQAVKILGMDGIPVTKIWGMAYLVSFLVLEVFDFLQPRKHRGYRTLEMDDEEVLDGYFRLPGSLAVLTQHFCFLLQLSIIPKRLYSECVLKSGSSPPGFDEDKDNFAWISTGPLMGCFAFAILIRGFLNLDKEISHRSMQNVAPSLGGLVEGGRAGFGLAAINYYFSLFTILNSLKPTCSVRAAVVQVVAISLLLASTVLSLVPDKETFEYRWFPGLSGLPILQSRESFGLLHSRRKEGSLIFAAANVAGIICYYVCIYDPSNTYKPPWTEYLG